jgi:peroxiredoxin
MPSLFDSINPINAKFISNFIPRLAREAFDIGSLAPDFELPNQHGVSVNLSDFRGKPVLLVFTRVFTDKIFCPLCFPHLQNLRRDYERFKTHNAEIVLITSTPLEMTQTIVQEQGFEFPTLSDEAWRVFNLYELGAALGAPLPAQFLLDKDGKIIFQYVSGTGVANQLPLHPENDAMLEQLAKLAS